MNQPLGDFMAYTSMAAIFWTEHHDKMYREHLSLEHYKCNEAAAFGSMRDEEDSKTFIALDEPKPGLGVGSLVMVDSDGKVTPVKDGASPVGIVTALMGHDMMSVMLYGNSFQVNSATACSSPITVMMDIPKPKPTHYKQFRVEVTGLVLTSSPGARERTKGIKAHRLMRELSQGALARYERDVRPTAVVCGQSGCYRGGVPVKMNEEGGWDEVIVPTFAMNLNPTITLSEIKARRFHIVDRAQIKTLESIRDEEDKNIFASLAGGCHMNTKPADDRVDCEFFTTEMVLKMAMVEAKRKFDKLHDDGSSLDEVMAAQEVYLAAKQAYDRPAGPEDIKDIQEQIASVANDPNLSLVNNHFFERLTDDQFKGHLPLVLKDKSQISTTSVYEKFGIDFAAESKKFVA